MQCLRFGGRLSFPVASLDLHLTCTSVVAQTMADLPSPVFVYFRRRSGHAVLPSMDVSTAAGLTLWSADHVKLPAGGVSRRVVVSTGWDIYISPRWHGVMYNRTTSMVGYWMSVEPTVVESGYVTPLNVTIVNNSAISRTVERRSSVALLVFYRITVPHVIETPRMTGDMGNLSTVVSRSPFTCRRLATARRSRPYTPRGRGSGGRGSGHSVVRGMGGGLSLLVPYSSSSSSQGS